MSAIRTIFYVLLLTALLAGCASAPYSPPSDRIAGVGSTDVDSVSGSDKHWRICRFRMNWAEGEDPNWAVDHLIAHGIFADVLDEHASSLQWWRFHRRAARDHAGHQFKFLFYSDGATAESIFTAIEKSALLASAVKHGLIKDVRLDDMTAAKYQQVEATSDPNWSPAIQRHWPSYIMGVSALWLGLIEDAMAAQQISDSVSFDERLTAYREAERLVTEMWKSEGQHAFLHHISAIFGYEPMLIRKQIRF